MLRLLPLLLPLLLLLLLSAPASGGHLPHQVRAVNQAKARNQPCLKIHQPIKTNLSITQ